MHAWVSGLGSKAPSTTIGKILTREINANSKNMENKFYVEVSDVIVFDFLIDGFFSISPFFKCQFTNLLQNANHKIDHDRFGTHNWKLAHDNKLLVWDSGLAWNFGPFNGKNLIHLLLSYICLLIIISL